MFLGEMIFISLFSLRKKKYVNCIIGYLMQNKILGEMIFINLFSLRKKKKVNCIIGHLYLKQNKILKSCMQVDGENN